MDIIKTCKNCDAYNTWWHPTEFKPKCEMTEKILENTDGCEDWGPNQETELAYLRSENKKLKSMLADTTREKTNLFKRLHLAKRDNRHNRNKLRRQLEQATKYSFTDSQLWSFDYHLAKVILPGLIRFKKVNVNSHPGTVTFEEWLEILDKMIWSFSEIVNDEENYPIRYTDIASFKCEQREDGNYVYVGTPLTDEERTAVEEYFAKKQEGLELFGKYYLSLWD